MPVYSRGVDGSDYMPGLIGLNNIKNTDYVNVVVQLLARIPPIRDFFLLPSTDARKAAAAGRVWRTGAQSVVSVQL